MKRHHPEAPVEQGVVRDSESLRLTLKEALSGAVGGRATEEEEQEGVEGKVAAREVETEEAVRKTAESEQEQEIEAPTEKG